MYIFLKLTFANIVNLLVLSLSLTHNTYLHIITEEKEKEHKHTDNSDGLIQ